MESIVSNAETSKNSMISLKNKTKSIHKKSKIWESKKTLLGN